MPGVSRGEPEYKVVETSVVTDEEIERLLNQTVQQGWSLDGIHFAMRDTSKRPSMAFLIFSRMRPEDDSI